MVRLCVCYNHRMKIITLVLVLIFLGAIGYALLSDQSFLVSQEVPEDEVTLSDDLPELPILGRAPEVAGIHEWINTEPFMLEDLRGKVVLVDFWTYSCINCIRTLPHLKSWHEKYKDSGLVLLGVHTPEFEFEKKYENVLANVQENDITYPVALDNDYTTWRAFNNRYWPASYLVDEKGNIRYTHFGEGRYEETESAIQALLLEANLLSRKQGGGVSDMPLSPNFEKIGTPEIYLGTARGINPSQYFEGAWEITPEYAELTGESGKIIIQYTASKVHMVLDTRDQREVILGVKLDGQEESEVIVNGARLYNLVDTGDEYGTHILEIEVKAPGLQAFTFTFG
jgi:thiol-disulfide isomerase/thioredoxin